MSHYFKAVFKSVLWTEKVSPLTRNKPLKWNKNLIYTFSSYSSTHSSSVYWEHATYVCDIL